MIKRSEVLGAALSIGEPVDWDEVYETELSRIYNYFLYRVYNRELAQDLTSMTFERAWGNRIKYDAGIASLSTWLLGIARNVLREHFRKSKAIESETESVQNDEQLPSVIDVEQIFQERQDKELLQNLLLELTERERDLIALKYGAGLSNREIARIVELSESNVGSILHRTVASLRKRWDGRYGR